MHDLDGNSVEKIIVSEKVWRTDDRSKSMANKMGKLKAA
jgi:hypothetical protein